MTLTNNEIELLLSCSKPRMDGESAGRICCLLQEEMDWDWIINTAGRHGILPLLYRNLKAVCPEAVPQDILVNLQRTYLINSRRNLVLTRELLRIIEDLQEHGMEVVPIKGPSLAQMAYENIALRQFSDLDIMVRRQDVLKVKNLLISQGYKPEFKFTYLQERLYLQRECEYNFIRDDPVIPVPIEVHWMFHPCIRSVQFYEGIWSRLETLTFEGRAVPCFQPEDLVLALCIHGMKHKWYNMKLVSDLAGLLLHHQMDWDQIKMRARDASLERMVHIGLGLARDLLNVELPENMFNEIKKDTIAGKLILHLSEPFSESDRQYGAFQECLFWLRTRERLRDKARCLFIQGMEPTLDDLDAVHLPESLFQLYWIVRPVRLFYRYGLKRNRI